MKENNQQIILFYKYTKIENTKELMDMQIALCKKLNLKCRMIIAEEGINGNLEGEKENTEMYITEMEKDPRFNNVHWKRSAGAGNAFPKISVKIRSEILSIGLGNENFDPNVISGKYISAEELHALYEKNEEEFYVIDMRNDFEHEVGFFEDSIRLPLSAMRELPQNMDIINHLKHKKIITVCTGGVKCEKASGFLIKSGFTDVYQLHGGIHAYIEKYPNQRFKGALYVYDGRIVMGFELDSPTHEIVSKCVNCGEKSELYVDCAYIHCKDRRHFITCENCLDSNKFAFCSSDCKNKAYSEEKFSALRTDVKVNKM